MHARLQAWDKLLSNVVTTGIIDEGSFRLIREWGLQQQSEETIPAQKNKLHGNVLIVLA